MPIFIFFTQICDNDEQKAAWFESDFHVICASYIFTLLTVDNGLFCQIILLLWELNITSVLEENT